MIKERRQNRRVMVILAHPDDPEYFCGGTVARWAQEGDDVTYVLATRGERGTNDPRLTPTQLALIREEEQRAAARVLGVREVVFLDYPDGSLSPDLNLRRDLTRQIRRHQPDVVITCDPTVRYRPHYLSHPDHLAVGDAALDAVFPDARNPLQFPELLEEGLEPHHVAEVYISGAAEPDTEVDITDSLQRKVTALREHHTQVSDPDGLEERLREWHRVEDENGQVRYVERFRRIVLGR